MSENPLENSQILGFLTTLKNNWLMIGLGIVLGAVVLFTSAVLNISQLAPIVTGWFVEESEIRFSDKEAFNETLAENELESALALKNTIALKRVCKDSIRIFEYSAKIKLDSKNIISDFSIECDIATRRPANREKTQEGPPRIYSRESSSSNSSEQGSEFFAPMRRLYQIDSELGIDSCKKAIVLNPRNPRFHYQLARSYHAKKNYPEAAKYYELASILGSGKSYKELGYLYGGGKLGKSDFPTAINWFKKGIRKGYSEPLVALAYYKLYGFGTNQDAVQARLWFEKAYAKKLHSAAIQLGNFNKNGFGESRNLIAAFNYYSMAANWGNSDGYLKMADLLLLPEFKPQNADTYSDAASLVEKAIKLDDNPRGTYYKGWLYERGWGVPKSDFKALTHYHKALKKGYAYAGVKLGKIYRYGLLGQKQNILESFRYFNIATNLGSSFGILQKVDILLDGVYFPKSKQQDSEARRLLEAVEDEIGGSVSIKRYLAWMKLHGRGFESDTLGAISELEYLFNSLKDRWSGIILGNLYRDGKLISENIAKAKQHYLAADLLGDVTGQIKIINLYINGKDGPITASSDKLAFSQVQELASRHKTRYAYEQLAWMYRNGIGTTPSFDSAIEYYKRAYSLGSKYTPVKLGRLYETGGTKITASNKLALFYYKKAISRDNFDGYLYIADMLFESKLFAAKNGKLSLSHDEKLESSSTKKQSDELAIEFIRKNLQFSPNNGWGLRFLAWAYRNGRGVPKDHRLAIDYYQKSADVGDLNAIKFLAMNYSSGIISNPDEFQSIHNLNLAAAKNDIWAMSILARNAVGLTINNFHEKNKSKDCPGAELLFKKILLETQKQRRIRKYSEPFFDFSYEIEQGAFEVSIEPSKQLCAISRITYDYLPLVDFINTHGLQFNTPANILLSKLLVNGIQYEHLNIPERTKKIEALIFEQKVKFKSLRDEGEWLADCISSYLEILPNQNFSNALKYISVAVSKLDVELQIGDHCHIYEMLQYWEYAVVDSDNSTHLSALLNVRESLRKNNINSLIVDAWIYSLGSNLVHTNDILNRMENDTRFDWSHFISADFGIRLLKEASQYNEQIIAANSLFAALTFGSKKAKRFLLKLEYDNPIWPYITGRLISVCALSFENKNDIKYFPTIARYLAIYNAFELSKQHRYVAEEFGRMPRVFGSFFVERPTYCE